VDPDKVERPYEKAGRDEQMRIMRRLNAAEAFETFLQTKFVGQKRFSLEGGESSSRCSTASCCRPRASKLDEVCIGMPHRWRLNVLANIAGKSYGQIFRSSRAAGPQVRQGSGDVKYHLGTEGEFVSEDGSKTKVYLAANPSHLEAVNPVLEGIVRAKQDRLNLAGESFTVLPVLMHGDAAFAGPGRRRRDAQPLAAARLPHRRHDPRRHQQPGRLHDLAEQLALLVYSTDVARMIQAPIFHVNGDDPEACVRVAELAYEFRQEFNKDVVIDMVCYRRRGPQRGRRPVDDPAADVQPHRGQALGPQALHRVAHRPRRHHRRGRRGRAARLPAAARAGLRRDQEATKRRPDSPRRPDGSDSGRPEATRARAPDRAGAGRRRTAARHRARRPQRDSHTSATRSRARPRASRSTPSSSS
jgi:2-oxoglutarate dehydrogenase E1 component